MLSIPSSLAAPLLPTVDWIARRSRKAGAAVVALIFPGEDARLRRRLRLVPRGSGLEAKSIA